MLTNKRKYKAFTLAELMVIMAVMTVVIAAVAPIFTSRFTNVSFDNVWSTVGASNTNDIYTDAPIHSMMQQILIGITPIDMYDVRQKYRPYSKLIIRSSNKISGITYQKQIEFKYNNNTVGNLFAANTNLLLGGNYNSISFDYSSPNYSATLPDYAHFTLGARASGNTAIGAGALDSLTEGKNNSAFGYYALNKVTTGSMNTAIGVSAGSNLQTGSGNVIVGYNSYNASAGNYNTIIGNNTSSKSSESNYTTAVGNNINVKGDYNVAIGDSSNAGGTFNTAVGYGALESANPASDTYSNFKYNTAIGYKSCSGISGSASNTTCVGGSGIDSFTMNNSAVSFFNDAKNRVLIGRGASAFGSAATLEVHSLSSSSSKYPYPDTLTGALGDSSVIVNGNLIVRGQTFMVGRSPFPILPSETSSSASANTISLMGYRLYKESALSHKPLIGVDGSEHLRQIKDGDGVLHQTFTGKEHCICSYSCSVNNKDYQGNSGYIGRDSYDWSSRNQSTGAITVSDIYGNEDKFYQTTHVCSELYNTSSDSAYNIELNKAHGTTNATFESNDSTSEAKYSCCPTLGNYSWQTIHEVSSDLRLKNIFGVFENGLSYLDKIKIYNYTFKNDPYKVPHVGVIAQNLKQIFPNSVTKDDKGYYQIRTDEMFYAAINSVKELNNNITNLFSKINNYIVRINKLKQENQELQNRLQVLAKELDELEK